MILALWSHPRSLSTVFERIMIERGDMQVLHEPFSYVYYGTDGRRQLDDMVPDDDHPNTYAEVRDACLRAAGSGPVFLKDMAYHALDNLLADPDFLGAVTHTFLIRDPARSIPSHFALDPQMTLEEVGLEAESRLFDAVTAGGAAPIVVDAEQLRRDARGTLCAYCDAVGIPFVEESLRWQKSTPPQWTVWETWHRDAADSEGIETRSRTYANTVDNDERLHAFHDHHRRFYERLHRHRIRPATVDSGPVGGGAARSDAL